MDKSQDMALVRMAAGLAALGHATRLSIILYIAEKQPKSVSAGELCGHLGIPHNKLNFHTEKLKEADLLLSRQQGREVYYDINVTELEGLLKQLMQSGLRISDVKYRLSRPAIHTNRKDDK